MKISVYTFVKDGLFYDFHVVAMLRHHLPFADEIIVNEGFSKDGTYEAICDLDPKIKVHRFEWDRSDPNGWHRAFKNQARELCTGDWCVMLDCDEFLVDWEFARLRDFLTETDKLIVPVRFVHFYGNHRVHIAGRRAILPTTGLRIHRNIPEIEVWGDGANVRLHGESDDLTVIAEKSFEVHHFGTVRDPARLRQKWRMQARQHNVARPRWDRTPSFMFDAFPHQWSDPDFLKDLAIYEGPDIAAVRDDPDEFVRDELWLYEQLKAGSTDGVR